MHRRFSSIMIAGLALIVAPGAAPERVAKTSTDGEFVTLFNGKDLSGWHGLETMDPRNFEAMSPEKKAAALEKGAADMKKHWRVEDGVIVNDGHGAYLTSDKDYGDIELKVDFKIGPKGDSGVYLRGESAGPDLGLHREELCPQRGRQGLRRPVEQQPGAPGQRSPGPGRQADRRVEQLPDHPGRRADHGLSQR